MWFDEEYESGMTLENLSMLFSQEERSQIKEKLHEQNIGVLFFEKRGVQASFFDAAAIYINAHLTELILTGLLAPAAYDVIKATVSAVIYKIEDTNIKFVSIFRRDYKKCQKIPKEKFLRLLQKYQIHAIL